MFDCGLTLTWHAVRRQLAGMPHELYLVRLIHAVITVTGQRGPILQSVAHGAPRWTLRQDFSQDLS
jgi:hypothetical protein